jgi:hypothetical protein
MATPSTRAEFKTYCLRKLGFPVIEINVDDDQVEDRIDDALSYFQDHHFDGTEKMYMKHQLTAADINRRWIYCPDAVTFVTGVFPFNNSNASINMFDLRYQLRLHDLYDFTSVSYVSYEITMQHLRTLEMLFSGTPQFRFNRKQNKVFIDMDWTRDVRPGDYVIIECYRSLNPATITLTGTLSYTSGSNVVTGYSTTFDQQFLENDFITFNGVDSFQVDKIQSPTTLLVRGPMVNTAANVSATISGNPDVWGDRFLKKYAYALIKMQWGNNLKKFAGVQLPGGVTLNGKEIYDEAVEEINKLEEEMQIINVLPNEILVG